MAKHVKIGKPINESEEWAFELLSSELPSDYLLITNLEILAQSGQSLEVDALILGEFAIYLLDVKGYVGSLSVDANIWTLDDRQVDNSLAKANYVSKVLAGRIGQRQHAGDYSPWCQGMVLVTGQRGQSISLRKTYPELSVFAPSTIIDALTSMEFVTSKYKHPITNRQRQTALDVIGKVGVMVTQKNMVQDFIKIRRLLTNRGMELWEAEYRLGDWSSDWLLKVVRLADGTNVLEQNDRAEELRNEFFRLQQLTGVSGVPSCAPIINDGEQLVLPIKRPLGAPLSVLSLSTFDTHKALNLIRRAAVSLQQIHRRGCILGSISSNDVFVSTDGDLEFLSSFDVGPADADLVSFRTLFQAIARQSADRQTIAWFEEPKNSDLETLCQIISSSLADNPSLDKVPLDFEVNTIIADRYTLLDLLSEEEQSKLWRARHLEGQFDCAITLYQHASEFWPQVKEDYFELMQLYHPALERIFDIGLLEANDAYYVTRSWVRGAPLPIAVNDATDSEIGAWFRTALTALQYLHNRNLRHKNITPENIICEDSLAILINFSSLPETLRIGGDLRYTDPAISDCGWTNDSDVYSLLMTFINSLEGEDQPTKMDKIQLGRFHKILGPNAGMAIQTYLTSSVVLPPKTNYLEYFQLETTETRIEELPVALASNWKISLGYMTFLVLDMLNDPRPRNRNQWVLNALRSRRIPGNKTNKGSMSSAISRLKTAKIVEDHGQKIRMTQTFLADWEKTIMNTHE
jgi:serine/threonine protein kinase